MQLLEPLEKFRVSDVLKRFAKLAGVGVRGGAAGGAETVAGRA